MSCPLALGTFACHLCLLLCARSVCGARARVPDMYNNATMGLGCLRGGGYLGGGPLARTCGPSGTRPLHTQEKCGENHFPQLEATSR